MQSSLSSPPEWSNVIIISKSIEKRKHDSSRCNATLGASCQSLAYISSQVNVLALEGSIQGLGGREEYHQLCESQCYSISARCSRSKCPVESSSGAGHPLWSDGEASYNPWRSNGLTHTHRIKWDQHHGCKSCKSIRVCQIQCIKVLDIGIFFKCFSS